MSTPRMSMLNFQTWRLILGWITTAVVVIIIALSSTQAQTRATTTSCSICIDDKVVGLESDQVFVYTDANWTNVDKFTTFFRGADEIETNCAELDTFLRSSDDFEKMECLFYRTYFGATSCHCPYIRPADTLCPLCSDGTSLPSSSLSTEGGFSLVVPNRPDWNCYAEELYAGLFPDQCLIIQSTIGRACGCPNAPTPPCNLLNYCINDDEVFRLLDITSNGLSCAAELSALSADLGRCWEDRDRLRDECCGLPDVSTCSLCVDFSEPLQQRQNTVREFAILDHGTDSKFADYFLGPGADDDNSRVRTNCAELDDFLRNMDVTFDPKECMAYQYYGAAYCHCPYIQPTKNVDCQLCPNGEPLDDPYTLLFQTGSDDDEEEISVASLLPSSSVISSSSSVTSSSSSWNCYAEELRAASFSSSPTECAAIQSTTGKACGCPETPTPFCNLLVLCVHNSYDSNRNYFDLLATTSNGTSTCAYELSKLSIDFTSCRRDAKLLEDCCTYPPPTPSPTTRPTTPPTQLVLTPNPTLKPTPKPTRKPSRRSKSQKPNRKPSSYSPTSEPTLDPTPEPIHAPTLEPTNQPTDEPTSKRKHHLSTHQPTSKPTTEPNLTGTPDTSIPSTMPMQATIPRPVPQKTPIPTTPTSATTNIPPTTSVPSFIPTPQPAIIATTSPITTTRSPSLFTLDNKDDVSITTFSSNDSTKLSSSSVVTMISLFALSLLHCMN